MGRRKKSREKAALHLSSWKIRLPLPPSSSPDRYHPIRPWQKSTARLLPLFWARRSLPERKCFQLHCHSEWHIGERGRDGRKKERAKERRRKHESYFKSDLPARFRQNATHHIPSSSRLQLKITKPMRNFLSSFSSPSFSSVFCSSSSSPCFFFDLLLFALSSSNFHSRHPVVQSGPRPWGLWPWAVVNFTPSRSTLQ